MGIPFAADGSHMKALSRTDNDVNWCLECTITAKSFSGAGSAINNMISQKVVFFNAVCDWNLLLASPVDPCPNRTYTTQLPDNL
ncbi:MAG: hypothetical protein Ta2E_10310 [Mycoplasmoidaceae bacterium]|nr:MAG: hypothetical protein Ta2E_10310 [Mycoplasmoidaceae bacterium]